MDKKNEDLPICCLQETSGVRLHTQTERKGMEKDISCKWEPEERWGSYISIKEKLSFDTFSKDKQNWQTFRLRKKREGSNKIRSEKGEVTTDTKEMQRTIRDYYE